MVVMKGISPFVATVILIAIAVMVGGIITFWATGLFKTQAETVGGGTSERLACEQLAGIRIKRETVKCDFSGNGTSVAPEFLNFSLENVGRLDLWDFLIKVEIGGTIKNFKGVDAITGREFTENFPLRPGEERIIKAVIEEDLPLLDASRVEVLSKRCPEKSDFVEFVDCTP
jgi:flagellin-like protein